MNCGLPVAATCQIQRTWDYSYQGPTSSLVLVWVSRVTRTTPDIAHGILKILETPPNAPTPASMNFNWSPQSCILSVLLYLPPGEHSQILQTANPPPLGPPLDVQLSNSAIQVTHKPLGTSAATVISEINPSYGTVFSETARVGPKRQNKQNVS